MKPKIRRQISREIRSYLKDYKSLNRDQNAKYASDLNVSPENSASESANSSPDLKKMQKMYGSQPLVKQLHKTQNVFHDQNQISGGKLLEQGDATKIDLRKTTY